MAVDNGGCWCDIVASMSKRHQIGGKKPKGFAALSERARKRIASAGGKAIHAMMGSAHMSTIGRRGAMARYQPQPKEI